MVAALALALAAGLAATPAAAPPVDVSSPVTIDVVVDDARGRSVESLTPGDFSVAEETVPLQIRSVRFVRSRGSAATAPREISTSDSAAVADDTRLFAIYLDEFHVTPGPAADYVRTTLAAFVRDQLGPHDFLVVLKPLQSILDIRLTSDREAIAREIESFAPRRGDLAPRTAFERNFIAGQPARVEAARAQIVASSLQALATQLSPYLPARKTLIVVSEGFGRATRRWGGEPQPNADSIALAANRAHVSIYPVDPSSALADNDGASADRGPLRDALRSLADRTTGRVLPPGDALNASLNGALGDASGYYALTIAAPASSDGRYHALSVSVRRPELAVRARSGYWSASAAETALINPPPPVVPFTARFARRTSPLVRAWFGMSRGADGATRVSFVWEPAPRVPGDRATPVVPARVALTVTTSDGTPVFEGVVLPSDGGATESGAASALASFDSPAGRLLVRMAIEDEGSRVVDRDVRDLVVDGFRGPLALGSVAVSRARSARDFRTIAADPSAPPVVSREFSRSERLLVRAPVFAAGKPPEVTARLLNATGQSMRTLTVAAAPASPLLYQVDLPLAGLAAGMYAVEFTVSSDDGETRGSLSFKVTP